MFRANRLKLNSDKLLPLVVLVKGYLNPLFCIPVFLWPFLQNPWLGTADITPFAAHIHTEK